MPRSPFFFDGTLAAWQPRRHRRTATSITPTAPPGPDTTAPPPTSLSLNATQTNVVAARAALPGADPEMGHLPYAVRMGSFGFLEYIPPSEGGWPVIYWVQSNSTFQSPNGEYVFRGNELNPLQSTSLKAAIGPNMCARVICPEKFQNIGTEWSNFMGLVLQGHHIHNTQWLGRTDIPLFKSAAEAEARINPFRIDATKGRPGKWYYNGTYRINSSGVISTGNPDKRIDSQSDTDTSQRLRQAAYGSSTSSTSNPNKKLSITVIEGMRLEGDLSPEALDTTWAGWTANHRIVIAGYNCDRVSVYYKKAPDGNYDSKEPGGDGGQFFGLARDLLVWGYTVMGTALQGAFVQINGSNSSSNADYAPRRVEFHNTDIHAMTPRTVGGVTEDINSVGGNQWYMTWTRGGTHGYGDHAVTQVVMDKVTVYQAGKSRAQLIHDEADFPEITISDVPYNVPPGETGITYVPPEQAAANVRATLASVGPLWSKTDSRMEVINGNVTITVDGTVYENKVVNGYITVKASNVTIRNVYQVAPAYAGTTKQIGIKCSDINATTLVPYTGTVVENVSLEVPVANRNVYQSVGINGGNYTISNSKISGYVDGGNLSGLSVAGQRRYGIVDRVYVWDLPHYDFDPDQTDGAHGDGWQVTGRAKLRLTNSVIYGGWTSALLIQQTRANVDGETNYESVYVDNNFLDIGTTGGSVININESGNGVIANLTITNNDFGNTSPASPRIIMPLTTKNASTTVMRNNKDAVTRADVVIANGG